MSLRAKFALLLDAAQSSVAYWRDIAITDFTRDLHARMERKGSLSHAELARRMGTSRPYVTKLLNGGNFTLETMVKLAMALDGVVRVHIADRDAVTTHWKDELMGQMQTDFESPQRLRLDRASDATPLRAPSGQGSTATTLPGLAVTLSAGDQFRSAVSRQ